MADGIEDMGNSMLAGYLIMFICLSTIFFAVKALRDKHLGGTITFGKGFLTGLYITLIAGVCYIISWEVYFQNSPSAKKFMEVYTAQTISKMKASGESAEKIEKTAKDMAQTAELYNNNALVRYGYTLIEILPVGLLISLVSAGVLRRKEFLPA